MTGLCIASMDELELARVLRLIRRMADGKLPAGFATVANARTETVLQRRETMLQCVRC